MANFDGELLSRTFKNVSYCFCRRCCIFESDRSEELPSFIRQYGGKLWKPFAILPNIEGQKFTIGETFTSRKKQGEFIFWKRPMKDQLNIMADGNLPVCEITCDENKYWVTPLLSGGEVVAVNDIAIQDSTELKFGDYLSLGVPATPDKFENWKRTQTNFFPFPTTENEHAIPECPTAWANKELDAFKNTLRLFLLFQRREYDFDLFWKRELEEKRKKTSKNDSDDDDLDVEHVEKTEAGFTPQLDELAVSHILSYLPLNDVKNARFLSRVWNQEALRLIKKKGLVKLDFSFGYQKLDDSTKLLRYNHEMEVNPIPHWRITIPSIGLDEDWHEVHPSQGGKIIADLHWFLGLRTHNVTTLQLGGTIASKFDYKTQVKILRRCPTQTIQYFELGWTWRTVKTSGRRYKFPSSIKFTNLKTIAFSMDDGDYRGDHSEDYSSLTPLLTPLISAVKGVRVLILDCPCSPLLGTFYDLAQPFWNLEEITIKETLTLKGLNFLNKLKKPLRKMTLGRFEYVESAQYLEFGRLLRKHSQTLTSLEITLGNWVNSNTVLNLPIFPSLKELHMWMDFWCHEDETFKIKLSFDGDDVISYSKHFPSLQTLELGEDDPGIVVDANEKNELDLLDIFFPLGHGVDGDAGFQVCKTLRHLDLPAEATLESGQIFARVGKIARMFPNVLNPWINKARESSENPTEQVSSN
ncbi:uncharacterized protein LOC118434015 [Folsomia candida]|uniref:F-box domain-containing protein n=1 Tax=Folsomia candida TaxID=158441 RepID=A0A226F1N7_FOLCA|nr:uncharacterized protein LOC118434015 [Folsomia candida]OXA62856.1 hypothetical protein Fcan01_00809 [Folsomia candida]